MPNRIATFWLISILSTGVEVLIQDCRRENNSSGLMWRLDRYSDPKIGVIFLAVRSR